jgi:hypothetical protein
MELHVKSQIPGRDEVKIFLAFMMITAATLAAAEPAPAGAAAVATNHWKNLPQGPQVYGLFEGRSPCQEIARLLKAEGRDECIKIKWQLILFQDPITGAPTTYALGGFSWRNPPKMGKWAFAKGTKEDPKATVIKLDPENPRAFLSFMKADENILLFMDPNGELLVGNEDFSFTLNRVVKK